jgi:hypothetical protein
MKVITGFIIISAVNIIINIKIEEKITNNGNIAEFTKVFDLLITPDITSLLFFEICTKYGWYKVFLKILELKSAPIF